MITSLALPYFLQKLKWKNSFMQNNYLFLLVKPLASTIHNERLMSVRHSRSLEGSRAFFTLKDFKSRDIQLPVGI